MPMSYDEIKNLERLEADASAAPWKVDEPNEVLLVPDGEADGKLLTNLQLAARLRNSIKPLLVALSNERDATGYWRTRLRLAQEREADRVEEVMDVEDARAADAEKYAKTIDDLKGRLEIRNGTIEEQARTIQRMVGGREPFKQLGVLATRVHDREDTIARRDRQIAKLQKLNVEANRDTLAARDEVERLNSFVNVAAHFDRQLTMDAQAQKIEERDAEIKALLEENAGLVRMARAKEQDAEISAAAGRLADRKRKGRYFLSAWDGEIVSSDHK
jgi:hypothetical protein